MPPRGARWKPPIVRLILLAETAADRQVLARADVVLHVDAGLHLAEIDARIADVAREGGRLARRCRPEGSRT